MLLRDLMDSCVADVIWFEFDADALVLLHTQQHACDVFLDWFHRMVWSWSDISSTEAMASGDGGLREPPNEQAVLNIYEAMRSELSQIYSNITDLEMQVSEHSLVINAIQPLDQSRKCFRMIGGVLVERTVVRWFTWRARSLVQIQDGSAAPRKRI